MYAPPATNTTTMDAEGKVCVLRASTIGGGNIVIEEVDGIRLLLDGKQNCIFGLIEGKDMELLKKEALGLGRGTTIDFEKQEKGLVFKICGGETVDCKAGNIYLFCTQNMVLWKMTLERKGECHGYFACRN